MKYGNILGGFKKGVSEQVDSKAEWKGLAKELEKTRKAIEKSTAEQKKLEETNKKLLEQREKLNDELSKVSPNSKRAKEIKKELASNEKEFKSNWGKMSSSIEASTEAKKDAADITMQLNEAKGFKGLAKNLGQTATQTEALGVSVGDFLGAMQAGPAGLLVVAATVMAEVSKMTYEMMKEQNEAMINLERSTGGLASAATLGTNKFGRLEGSILTVGDVTRRANISLEQFSDTMQGFYGSGGGFTMGAGDLRQRKTAMMELGVWGARIKKLYGADIIPAIRTLFQNWGEDGIMSLTEMMHDGVMQAKSEGLDPEQFAKNMNDVAKMSGKLTFKNGVKGMKEMAMYATKMGANVEDIANGFSEMNSFTDIFENQARLGALGFNNLGASQGKVFGQRMQGDALGAYQTELEGIVQDLENKGGVDSKTGNLTEEGKFMLGPNGLKYSQEQIQQVINITHGMKKWNLSLKQAIKPMSEWPESVKEAMKAQERANRTLSEQWAITTGEFKAAVTDRLALLFGPFLESLANKLGEWNTESQTVDAYRNAVKTGDYTGADEALRQAGGKENTNFEKLKSSMWNTLTNPLDAAMSALKINTPGAREFDLQQKHIDEAKVKLDVSKLTEAEQTKLQENLNKSADAIESNTEAIDQNTASKKLETKSVTDQIQAERDKKREFLRANQGAILDSAMRDLVKYGSVAAIKTMSVPSMDEQYKKSQEEQKAAAAPVINITTNTKVDAITGDIKTAISKG